MSEDLAPLIRGDKVSDRAAKAILEDIQLGGLKPGDMLPAEARMLERYGTGRASLREALRLLESNGIIRVKAGPRGGPIVADADAAAFGRTTSLHFQVHGATYRDLMDARCVIEPVLAGLAARNISAEQGEQLRSLLADENSQNHTQTPLWIRVAQDFHSAVAQLANNQVLSLYSVSLSTILQTRLGRAVVPESERPLAVKAHNRIAEAIAAGDEAEASRLMTRHLEALREEFEKFGPGVLDEPIAWQ